MHRRAAYMRFRVCMCVCMRACGTCVQIAVLYAYLHVSMRATSAEIVLSVHSPRAQALICARVTLDRYLSRFHCVLSLFLSRPPCGVFSLCRVASLRGRVVQRDLAVRRAHHSRFDDRPRSRRTSILAPIRISLRGRRKGRGLRESIVYRKWRRNSTRGSHKIASTSGQRRVAHSQTKLCTTAMVSTRDDENRRGESARNSTYHRRCLLLN